MKNGLFRNSYRLHGPSESFHCVESGWFIRKLSILSLCFLLSKDSEFLKNPACRVNIIKQSPQEDRMVWKSGFSVGHAASSSPVFRDPVPTHAQSGSSTRWLCRIAGLSFLPSSPQEWSAQKRQEWATTLPYPTTQCRRSISYLPR